MPISPEDLTVHFTSTLMALIRTALEIKLATGERGATCDRTCGAHTLLHCGPETTEMPKPLGWPYPSTAAEMCRAPPKAPGSSLLSNSHMSFHTLLLCYPSTGVKKAALLSAGGPAVT